MLDNVITALKRNRFSPYVPVEDVWAYFGYRNLSLLTILSCMLLKKNFKYKSYSEFQEDFKKWCDQNSVEAAFISSQNSYQFYRKTGWPII